MNPANPGLPRTSISGTWYDNNQYSAVCVKCHQRNPSGYTQDNVGLGSHFVFGGPSLRTANTAWEKIDAWPSGALSRYGAVNDNVSVVGVPGELICESCHSLRTNSGRAKLVVNDNVTTD